MKRILMLAATGTALVAIGYVIGALGLLSVPNKPSMLSPLGSEPTPVPTPLYAYTIPALREYAFQANKIIIDEVVSETDEYQELLFHFTTVGKQMSGMLTIPGKNTELLAERPVLVMVRGYVPPESYVSGIGTQPAAHYFASQGYTTFAPDFFGFGTSDPEPTDEWEARFIKPIVVVELIKSIEQFGASGLGFSVEATDQIGIWAHSNGGQIALTALEITSAPLPTTLWAPVTAPFPYSILFYGDETEDEGKQQRAWLALFEKIYDASRFSLTRYLGLLNAPLQIHHGTLDEAAPIAWSDEFAQKLDNENNHRESLEETATPSAALHTSPVLPIEYNYYKYPGADHNLRPIENWSLAIQRDMAFFDNTLD